MRPLLSGLIALMLTASPVAVRAAPASWVIVHDESRLGFIATQDGNDFEGEFARFEAEMRFSRDALDESRFDVTIDVTSINAGSAQRNDMLPDQAWFHFERFPQATYVTREIRQGRQAPFVAVGALTLRGIEREVLLPFDWQTRGDRARMQGRTTLDRTDFGIGQGEWADDDTVAYPVVVVVDLTLERSE